jgi:cytochrome bd-type quinol oxidase subunit 2
MVNKKETNLFSRLTQVFLVFGFVGLIIPQVCLGATAFTRLKNVVSSKPTYEVDKTTQNTLTDYIGNIIAVFLGLLGSIFVILIIYAGYTWMTASGNMEKVTKAQHTLRSAVIGLLVLVAVYAMWIFLFAKIVKT